MAMDEGWPPVQVTERSPRTLADVVVEAAGDKKAEDILVVNVSELTTIDDLFVICTGRGERQVQAIADAVREKATEAGRHPLASRDTPVVAGCSSISATSWCTHSSPKSDAYTDLNASGAMRPWCCVSPSPRLAPRWLALVCRQAAGP